MAHAMTGFMDWMENRFMPVATKIGNQRHLVAIRDGFISIMPITMVGSIATLLNVFLRDLPTMWWGDGNAFTAACAPIIAVNGVVWNGSLAILGLAFAFTFGYYLSRSYQVNAVAGGVIALSAVICTMNMSPAFDYLLPGVGADQIAPLQAAGLAVTATDTGVTLAATGSGMISTALTSASGPFTCLIFALLSTQVYVWLTLRKITIKLPENVPPAVSNAFAAIIPGVAAVYASAIVTQVCVSATGDYPNALISVLIQQPLLGMSQSPLAVILVNFLIQLFWFFGIHGSNVMAPVLEGIYTPALLENLNVWNTTHDVAQMPYLWTRGSFDAYTMMGGTGITLGLIIAILLFSKRKDSRTIAAMSAPMGVFNINEPMVFGMPIVLNPLYFIPWVLVPVITKVVALLFTYSGVIPPCFIQVPWIMPVGLYAFFATGGNVLAALVALLNLGISFAIWTPFVLLANRQLLKSEPEKREA